MFGHAAKLMLQTKLFKLFAQPDLLALALNLGEKGKKNREYAIEILRLNKNKEITQTIINHFSTETHFEFAFDIV